MTSSNLDPGRGAFATTALLEALSGQWWLLRLRGVAALVFGLLAFHVGDESHRALALLWGAYSLLDGLLVLWAAVTGRTGTPRPWLALTGLAGIASATMAFTMSATVAAWLVLFVAAWAIVTGIMQVAGAIQLRKVVEADWILALDGIMTIVFGIALVAWPRIAEPALVWLVGWFGILLGSLYIAIGYWLRPTR
ncbi:MAG: DUF308 domain-containing protein [Alphaproteobacteria bacterium]|nr:DUF308 domain-containing protein [Alphaproteobacteria bacterium]MBV8408735.1 DUF308 domain-containing protein [Alphaproteobacteria bacterium]